jgi:hypothetical protein
MCGACPHNSRNEGPQIKALVSGETRACGHRVARGWGLGAGGATRLRSSRRARVLFHPASNIQDGPNPDPNEPATRDENAGGDDKVAPERNSQDAR